jgi:hypothetical protein
MKLLILGMMALGLACLGFGAFCTQSGASDDERVDRALPFLPGAGIIIVAFVWLVARAVPDRLESGVAVRGAV